MKTLKRNQSKPVSKNIVAVKVMAFLSWIIYLGIAFVNNLMIEAFIFSVGLVIIGYFIFGRKTQRKQWVSSSIYNSRTSKEITASQNYLSVFFHSDHQVDKLNRNITTK
jgi:hypothetical protein